jgi:serine/threonine protein kinase
MLGKIISHYRIVEKLGGDGMGKVHRAQDPLLRRDMTNKVLPVTVSFDPDRLRCFEQDQFSAVHARTLKFEGP